MRYLTSIVLLLLVHSAISAQDADTICPSALRRDIRLENMMVDAAAAFSTGDIGKASDLLKEVHMSDSTNDAAVYYLGLCSYAGNRHTEAEQYFREAIRLDSLNLWYLNILANFYIDSGRPQMAAPLMQKLVARFPKAYNTPYFLSLIADSNVSQFKDSVAMSYYDRALEIDPEYAPAEMGKAELHRMRGNNPGFFASLGRVISNPEVVPKVKSSYLQNILDHIDAKTWWVWGDEFCRLVDVCTGLHPDDIGARWLKVSTCAIKDDWDGVLSQCMEIERIASGTSDKENLVKAYSTMGDIHHEQKNDEKSCFLMYEKALKIDPEYVPVLNNYAYYLCEKRIKLRKALKMSKVTVDKEPDNATYLDTYGWILHLLGRDSEAKPVFKHALIYGGRDSKVILQHYSEILKALGDNEISEYYRRLSTEE